VAAVLDGGRRSASEEHLDELALLADTAGYEVTGRAIQEMRRPVAATFLGRGKVEEIGRLLQAADCHRVVVDDDLTPQQAGKLEKAWNAAVSDRSGLILEIFSSRARSREARTQVELASLKYLLPRLARRWTHLSRQEGRMGVRAGVGETQIELDRRIIRRRIARLQRDLLEIQGQSRNRRQGRNGLYTVALVGYTNSGKSTLFNRMTAAGTLVEDRLFATLDPLRRRMAGEHDPPTVLTDTVGFIRKLPHHLVASFRSTLEEAGDADLLIEVVDASDPHCLEKMQVTGEVLEELGLAGQPRLLVFNKIDLLAGPAMERRLARAHPEALFLSARSGRGVAALRLRVVAHRRRNEVEEQLEIASGDAEALSVLQKHGRVVEMREEDETLQVRVRASRAGMGRILRALRAAERGALHA
jgi:GTP-binding protein HflX